MSTVTVTCAGFAPITGDELARAGVRQVVVSEPVTLSPRDTVQTLAFVRLLREAAGHAIRVRWHGRVDLDPRTRGLLGHLPPPDGDDAWSAGYRHGLCHYRRGPDFVLVTDRRHGEPATTRLLVGTALTTFQQYADVAPAPAGEVEFDRLKAAGLLLVLGGHAVALPYRLRRWPIPCNAV